MTNRRDVMADAGGSRELIEEHADNLLYKLEQLLDLLLDAEDTIEEQAKRIDELEDEVLNLNEEIRNLS